MRLIRNVRESLTTCPLSCHACSCCCTSFTFCLPPCLLFKNVESSFHLSFYFSTVLYSVYFWWALLRSLWLLISRKPVKKNVKKKINTFKKNFLNIWSFLVAIVLERVGVWSALQDMLLCYFPVWFFHCQSATFAVPLASSLSLASPNTNRNNTVLSERWQWCMRLMWETLFRCCH